MPGLPMTTVHLVTDGYSGISGLYVDGKLVEDLDDHWLSRLDDDALEAVMHAIPGVEYDSLSKHQLGRPIHGYDYTEWESYWPDAEADLPDCQTEGCCVFSDAPVPDLTLVEDEPANPDYIF